eukprot:TRINITY_DN24791_c2_g1_i1.p1 TRINITY_DN24791_c2_g1~~TRINITY_DN24791_c2_g1_i1.p1  ORF type:complete len:369 (+),score=43.29 TRINITY_DN24791_c2_g1_i1:575-1681(+)
MLRQHSWRQLADALQEKWAAGCDHAVIRVQHFNVVERLLQGINAAVTMPYYVTPFVMDGHWSLGITKAVGISETQPRTTLVDDADMLGFVDGVARTLGVDDQEMVNVLVVECTSVVATALKRRNIAVIVRLINKYLSRLKSSTRRAVAETNPDIHLTMELLEGNFEFVLAFRVSTAEPLVAKKVTLREHDVVVKLKVPPKSTGLVPGEIIASGEAVPRSMFVMKRYPATLAIPHCIVPHMFERNIAGLIHGVTYIHNAGLVHMDIKLPNIFVTDDGQWLLGDFGSCVCLHEKIAETTLRWYPIDLINNHAKVEFDWFMLWASMHAFLLGDNWQAMLQDGRASLQKLLGLQMQPRAASLHCLGNDWRIT